MNYSDALITAVGPVQYRRLADATDYYKEFGFEYIDAPWLVQQKVDHATKPPFVKPIHHHVSALNHTFHFAASGEQSFIQLQLDAHRNGHKMEGRYQTITPCYRDEARIDAYRRIGFMKLELIDWSNTTETNLRQIVAASAGFFSRITEVKIIENDLTHEHGLDIVTKEHDIELGSYGIRESEVGGYIFRWVYATGLAEPRLSVAIMK
jgi:hypothetical protein